MNIMMCRLAFLILYLVSTDLYARAVLDKLPPTGGEPHSRRALPASHMHAASARLLSPHVVTAQRQYYRPISQARHIRQSHGVRSVYAPAAVDAQRDKYLALGQAQAAAQNLAGSACDMGAYRSSVGAALVAHILQQKADCIAELYQASAYNYPVFSEQNMLVVASAAADLASRYTGLAEQANIAHLHYFLRAGYYHQFYSPKQMQPYTQALKTQLRGAIDAFLNNRYFYANSPHHALAISDIFFLIDSAEENKRYLRAVSSWLMRWNADYAQTPNMSTAVNGLFTVLYRGHQLDGFSEVATNTLIQRLGAFAAADWMLTSDALFMQENAARELTRFLRYKNAAFYPSVESGLQEVLHRYDLNGLGRSVWVAAADGIDYEKKCNNFNVCGFKQNLEASLLSIQHRCNDTLLIRAQAMNQVQLTQSCEQLAEYATVFHRTLDTKHIPVPGDINTQLEIVVFDSSAEYRRYAGVLFGVSTDNGGIYLEGEPTKTGNQARFIAYEAEWLLPQFEVWNLAHEFIHYLDGRYTLQGRFVDANTATHKTVWWIEGLAEYISKKNNYIAAINRASSQRFQLSEVFSTNYNHDQEQVYIWGYLAVRFMFEQHSDDLLQFIDHFKRGDYDGYLLFIDSLIGDTYNREWADWLMSVAVNNNEPVSLMVPDFVPEPKTVALSNGQTLDHLVSPSDGSDVNYYIDLPADVQNFTVSLANGSGDADLYLRYANKPDDSSYDCVSYLAGNNETCTQLNPANGRWYIRIKRHADYRDLSLTVSYTLIPDEPAAGPKSICEQQAAANYIQLQHNQPVCVSSTSSGMAEFYTWVAEGTSSVRISLTGGNGEADLYARSGTWPTTALNDASSVNLGNNETLEIAQPQTGWLYIIVQGRPSFSHGELTLVNSP